MPETGRRHAVVVHMFARRIKYGHYPAIHYRRSTLATKRESREGDLPIGK